MIILQIEWEIFHKFPINISLSYGLNCKIFPARYLHFICYLDNERVTLSAFD